jgi:hypothetical protein
MNSIYLPKQEFGKEGKKCVPNGDIVPEIKHSGFPLSRE